MARTAARAVKPGQRTEQLKAPFTVSPDNLLAYANDRISAAGAFPKNGLIRRDLRLAWLDMTVWFTSEQLAGLCEATCLSSTTARDPFEQQPRFSLWTPMLTDGRRRHWDEGAGFSSREFERILRSRQRAGSIITTPRPGSSTIRPPESEFTLCPRLWTYLHGSVDRLCVCFVHWAQAAAGNRLTHAAALGLNGHGALMVGASGSGKSGTTLAGLLNGLESVGDDYVVVEQGANVVANSVFRVFKQDLDGLRRVGVDTATVERRDTKLAWKG